MSQPTKTIDFYKGFEGNAEIIFILKSNDSTIKEIHMWYGYFVAFLETIKPQNNQWFGLAHPYRTVLNNWKYAPWRIEDISYITEQWKNIPIDEMDNQEKQIHAHVLDMLIEAATINDAEVWIHYD